MSADTRKKKKRVDEAEGSERRSVNAIRSERTFHGSQLIVVMIRAAQLSRAIRVDQSTSYESTSMSLQI